MGRVQAFKDLGEYAMLPAVRISKLVTQAVRDSAAAEERGDMDEAFDLLDWAEFLETEMML